MAKLSGGGITSNKLVSKREATRETPRTRAASPAGSDQLGQKVANPQAVKSIYDGPSFQPVKHGNELATNVGKGGPGKGRTVDAQWLTREALTWPDFVFQWRSASARPGSVLEKQSATVKALPFQAMWSGPGSTLRALAMASSP